MRGQTMNVYTHPERVSCTLDASVHKEEFIGVEQSQTVIG